MQKISPFLWFDHQAEEAVSFYTSLFDHSKVVSIDRYPDNPVDEHMKGMEGKVLTEIFELAKHRFMALNGGPIFKFTPSISFFVNGDSVEEVDQLWARLSDGGSILMPLQKYPFSEKYGWLADKYGLSWQLNVGARPQKSRPFCCSSVSSLAKPKKP
jgi:predicted 3-demethylubiquinone-9 3-methyltransferase (glyoxalase superfamily)